VAASKTIETAEEALARMEVHQPRTRHLRHPTAHGGRIIPRDSFTRVALSGLDLDVAGRNAVDWSPAYVTTTNHLPEELR
jgi:hypothetical protein